MVRVQILTAPFEKYIYMGKARQMKKHVERIFQTNYDMSHIIKFYTNTIVSFFSQSPDIFRKGP